MQPYGMFGWAFALYRAFASMIVAMVAGILTNLFDKEAQPQPVKEKPMFSTMGALQKVLREMNATSVAPSEEVASCCSAGSSCDSKTESKFSMIKALKYAFITLIGDIAKRLFWGLIIGALIGVAIPQNLSDILIEHSWLSYLIVISIAVPLYVCATASLPIAAVLMFSSVSAGAAFVFLSAGPAINTVTIGVVKKMLGSRSLYIYLGSIIIGSMLFGMGLDYIFDIANVNPKSLVHMDEHVGFISVASSLVLWGLVLYFLLNPYFKKELVSCC